jgi:transcriptional antiterminator RfaH
MTIDFWSKANWYAVQAKPSHLKLAVTHVSKLDLEVFLPCVKCDGEAFRAEAPLFPGYFFARFCPLTSFDAVRYGRGVLRILGTSRHPLPVEEEIIETIRERLQEDGLIHLERKAFQPGDLVTVEEGPFCGWMGKVEREWDDGKRVAILLDVIHQARVLVDRRHIVAAEAA